METVWNYSHYTLSTATGRSDTVVPTCQPTRHLIQKHHDLHVQYHDRLNSPPMFQFCGASVGVISSSNRSQYFGVNLCQKFLLAAIQVTEMQ